MNGGQRDRGYVFASGFAPFAQRNQRTDAFGQRVLSIAIQGAGLIVVVPTEKSQHSRHASVRPEP
jgi:hypothetical protein